MNADPTKIMKQIKQLHCRDEICK